MDAEREIRTSQRDEKEVLADERLRTTAVTTTGTVDALLVQALQLQNQATQNAIRHADQAAEQARRHVEEMHKAQLLRDQQHAEHMRQLLGDQRVASNAHVGNVVQSTDPDRVDEIAIRAVIVDVVAETLSRLGVTGPQGDPAKS